MDRVPAGRIGVSCDVETPAAIGQSEGGKVIGGSVPAGSKGWVARD
ncbi:MULTISPECIES: hypothetical protein [Rhizobium]|nr:MULTISPECIES: hypothetical protein [Rhizobium]MBB4332401.1 hypothetical protein [Rhizobium leguminosarum]MBB4357386.1 hypothetical protein [Rhizobium leguminosarum]MBB4552041.1 hypothetical protein [Rhizobium leguminosarum]MBB4564668.1 hypothetical protein [Rhizobium leguminosarum]MBB4591005.1 hypothetical protein [Rhizobium leguminosarum]